MGKIIIYIGIILVVIGLIVSYTPFTLNWFGKLPGDIRISKPNFSFYMPITSMIILSVVASILFWLYKKFFS
ncbi:MAG TPA: DUF2905 domain-containing protein [Flavobacteriaceae bacterium]|nr:DUF2905 domain-containing protein [Flavobacteriaceae bacterium]